MQTDGKWNERPMAAHDAFSEEMFRFFFEHAPEAIMVLDCEKRRFILANQNAERLFGLTREQLVEMDPQALNPLVQPDGRLSVDAALEWISRTLAGETPTFEWMYRHPSGRLIMCEVRLIRLPGPGKLIRGSIIDRSELKRRERIQNATYQISEAVHDAEDLDSLYARIHAILRKLMPAENFYIALYDASSQMISFPYFVDQLADAPPTPRRVTHGLTGYVLRTGKPLLLGASIAGRKRQIGETVYVEGLELPYIESGRPAAIWLGAPLTTRGKTFGVMAVQDYADESAYGEDEKQMLTFIAAQTALAIERKRSEQSLRESEEKFRALFEASSAGVMLHDEDKFVQVNPAAVRILRYNSADEIIGRHPAETSAPIQANGEPAAVAARRHIDECMATGDVRFEWIARSPAGEDVPLEVLLTRVQWKGRNMIQAVINDISERKRAEEELLKALAREKELGELKSSFVSMVSHEFRTPLGIIMSSADILLDYFEQIEVEERRRHLESIHKNTRRMAELMEEVLLLGKFEAGKMNFDPRPLDLKAQAHRIANDVLTATDQRCPIVISCEGLPHGAVGDERLLRHILVNVLSNAVKYSEPGQPVTFTIEAQEESAVCRVIDHGIGIPEPDREWLFNSFHRGRNVGNRPGSGLGLVIVKRCVDLHEGRIEIHSQVGEGTTVTIRLPLFKTENEP